MDAITAAATRVVPAAVNKSFFILFLLVIENP
jgi:hypothetical protein